MSDCKPTKKQGVKNGFNLSSISGVLKLILAAFSLPQQPAQTIPPQLIFLGAKMRTGVSAKTLASRTISRRSEAGLVTGDVFADGPNAEEAMEVIRCEELINMLTTEARIDSVLDPGVMVTTIGVGNLGIPVVSNGATTNVGTVTGIIS
jgi:hypothetical protein